MSHDTPTPHRMTVNSFPGWSDEDLPYIRNCIGIEQAPTAFGCREGVTVLDEAKPRWKLAPKYFGLMELRSDSLLVVIRNLVPKVRAMVLRHCLDVMVDAHLDNPTWSIFPSGSDEGFVQQLMICTVTKEPVAKSSLISATLR